MSPACPIGNMFGDRASYSRRLTGFCWKTKKQQNNCCTILTPRWCWVKHLVDLTLCMLCNFACFFLFFCRLWTCLFLLKKLFQEYHQSVKQFGSRLGPTFCWASSGPKLVAKVISRRQKLPAASESSVNNSNIWIARLCHPTSLYCHLRTCHIQLWHML